MMYSEKTQRLMQEAIYRVIARGDFGLKPSDWKIIHKAEAAMDAEDKARYDS